MFLVTITLLSAFLSGVYSTFSGAPPFPEKPKFPPKPTREDLTKTRWNSDKLSPEKSEIAFHAMVWKLCSDKNGPMEFYEMQERAKEGSKCPDLEKTYLEAIEAAYAEDVPEHKLGCKEWWEKLPRICNQSDVERGNKLRELTVKFSHLFTSKGCGETEMEPRHVCCTEMDKLIGDCANMMDYCECWGCCPKGRMGDTFSGITCEALGVKKDPKCEPEAKLPTKPM